MLLSKAYRFRLYPTPEQETLFRQAVGACRFVDNLALDQRKLERHRSEPRRLTAYDQIKFVSIQVAVEAAEPMGPFGAPVGIDLGIARPMALSTGEVIDLPRTGKGCDAPLSKRYQAAFCCVSCGHVAKADLNAARNILRRGLSQGTGGLPGMACGSNRVAARKQERRVAKRGSSAPRGRE